MKVRDLKKFLDDFGLDEDTDVIIRYETPYGFWMKDLFTVGVLDNGEKKFLVLGAIDPNEDPAARRIREFARGR